MALPLLPLLLSQGARYGATQIGRKVLGRTGRKIVKQTGNIASKYGNRAVTGAFYVDAVNEASKGNYEPLTDLAQFGLMGRLNRAGPILKVDDYISADRGLLKNVFRIGSRGEKIRNQTYVTKKIIKDEKGSSPVFDAGKNPNTKNFARENTEEFYYSTKGKKIPLRIAAKKEKQLVKTGKSKIGARVRFVDKEGNIATYLPADLVRKGSHKKDSGPGASKIKGYELIDGQIKTPTERARPVYTDFKMNRAESIRRKKQELTEGYKKLEAKNFETQLDKVDRTQAHLDYETKQIRNLFAERVKQVAAKGDKVNRLFYSSKDPGSIKAAKIYLEEAEKIGLYVRPMAKPSQGAVKNVKIQDVVKDQQYGSAAMQNTKIDPKTGNTTVAESIKQTDIADRTGKKQMLYTFMYAKRGDTSTGKAFVLKTATGDRPRGIFKETASVQRNIDQMQELKERAARNMARANRGYKVARKPEIVEKKIYAAPRRDDTNLKKIGQPKVRKFGKMDHYSVIFVDGKPQLVNPATIKKARSQGARSKYGKMSIAEQIEQKNLLRRINIKIKPGTLFGGGTKDPSRQLDLFKDKPKKPKK